MSLDGRPRASRIARLLTTSFSALVLIALGLHVVIDPGCAGTSADATSAPAPPGPPNEVRAIWVTRWDYKSPHDVRALVDNCASLGLNRIYLQVRGQADAFYRSSLEPWGEELDGDPERDGDPGFDPLETAVEACRKSRVQIFAWVNVLPGWKGAKPPRSKKHLAHVHPEWFLQDRKGRRRIFDPDRYALLNPCLQEVRTYLVNVIEEISRKYAIDGVQLDYVRFLRRDVQRGEDSPYDAATLSLFRKQTGGFPSRHRDEWDRFRRRAIDTLVEGISRAVRKARPGVLISVAAVQNLQRAREHLLQDAPLWLKERWVDEICPMTYFSSLAAFRQSVSTWLTGHSRKGKLVPGIGLYLFSDSRNVGEQVSFARKSSTGGYSLFGYADCFLSRSPLSSRSRKASERRAAMRQAVRALNRSPDSPATLTES